MTVRDVAVIVGSLRRESLEPKMAKALIELAPPSPGLKIIGIGDLLLYNEDLEVAGRYRRIWHKPPPSPIAGIPQYADAAAA